MVNYRHLFSVSEGIVGFIYRGLPNFVEEKSRRFDQEFDRYAPNVGNKNGNKT